MRYIGPDGDRVREPEHLARIRALAIPPAWTDVWICACSDEAVRTSASATRLRCEMERFIQASDRKVQDESRLRSIRR